MPKTKKEKTTVKKTSKPKAPAKPKKAPAKHVPAKPKAPAKALKTKPAAPRRKKEEAKHASAKPVLKREHKAPVKAAELETPVPQVSRHPAGAVPVPPAEKKTVQHKEPARASSPEAKEPGIQKKPAADQEAKPELQKGREIEIELPITLKDLAVKLQEKSSMLIRNLMAMGVMASINQALDEDTVVKLCSKYNCSLKKALSAEESVLQEHSRKDSPEQLQKRSPVVTFMGHVDHGKTSLLDAIRKTKVAEGEHGGITQHIGAYRVNLPEGRITFLDTPGHEAFTAMRARGARITDFVVLVVAADDGIMPQTEEAINHARAAGVAIIVAINKIDKPQANIDMVKKQLSEAGLTPEDWGGKTITVPVSAKTGEGMDSLLEMIVLQAEIMELKANPLRLASGVVVEAKMAKGRGPVATLLVQNGTLHLNQNIIVGNFYGKIRAMLDDRGQSVTAAGPAYPVEVLGITGVPQAGEQFFVIEDEKEAKDLVQGRVEKERQKQIKTVKRISLEDLHSQISEGKIKELKLIVKSDVQGSLEAIKDTLNRLNVSEIKIDIIHTGVGNINNSDVILAMASDALIVGFNVNTDDLAKEMVAKEGVEVKIYNIIYELANDIKAAIEGMLDPRLKRVFLGRAEVRKMFKLSRSGLIAGCMVTKGKFHRSSMVTVLRNGQAAFEGKLSSLKRFKDDVREVAEGFECGISIGGFDQLMEGDIIEAYDIEKIARRL